MSDTEKHHAMTSRQSKLILKTRFELLLWDENYDFLFRLAQAEGISMAAKLNEILRSIRSGKSVPRGIET